MAVKDLNGNKYGRLTVLKRDYSRKSRKAYWFCLCSCGKTKSVRSDSLQTTTKSCGCLKKEQDEQNLDRTTHEQTGTRLHSMWIRIKSRCLDPNIRSYKDYGGRGIKVCKEWNDDYMNFKMWAESNGYEDHLSIERIDNDGDYEPSNCTFIKMSEQANNRRTTIWVEYKGEKLNITQWSKKLGFNRVTLYDRYHRGDRPPYLFRKVR